MKTRKIAAAVFLFLFAATIISLPFFATGCTGSAQAQLDRAEVLYGTTVGGLDTAYETGMISPKTQLQTVSPARKEARKALDAAKASYKLGDPGWKVLLDTANGILLDLQKKYTPGAATKPSAATIRAGSPIQTAGGIPAALLLLQVISQLAPVAAKMFKGEELTPEERALAEKHSADADARADADDADAAKRA